MSERKVEFSGTMQNTVSETTQNKFTGTGKIIGPPIGQPIRIIAKTVVIAIPLSITASLLTFKMLDDLSINLFENFLIPPPIESSPSNISPESPEQNISAKQRKQAHEQDMSSGIVTQPNSDGYLVIVKAFDKQKDAMGFASKIRQKRINANYFAQEAKYHVYVGPFYAKRSAVSALNAVHQAGFTEAYLQPPYSR